MKWAFCVSILLVLNFQSLAQDTSLDYKKYIDKGDTELLKGNNADFEVAINAYSTAMRYSSDNGEETKRKILEAFKKKETVFCADASKVLGNELAFTAQELLKEGYRTKAFQLAAFTEKYIDPGNLKSHRILHESYYYNDENKYISDKPRGWSRNFIGHTSIVRSINKSPDGRYIVSVGIEGEFKIWEAATGEEIQTFKLEKYNRAYATSARFSSDGKYILTHADGNVIKVDWKTGKIIQFIESYGFSTSVHFSPIDNFVIMFDSWSSVKLINLKTAEELFSFPVETMGSWDFNFSPNEEYFATADEKGRVILWSTADGQKVHTLKGHKSFVNSAEFSKDGKYLVTASRDKTIKIWNVSTGKKIRTLNGCSDFNFSATLSSDNRYVLTTCKNSSMLLNVSNGAVLKTFAGQTTYFSPGDKYIIWRNKKRLTFWEVSTRSDVYSIENDIYAGPLFFTEDRFFTASQKDNSLQLHEISHRKLLRSFGKGNTDLNSSCISPDGKYFVTTGWENKASLWSISSGQIIRSFVGHTNYVRSANFSPDGKYLVTASKDMTAKLWDVISGEEICTFSGHTSRVMSASFSPDGKYLVTASEDKTAKLWNIDTRSEIRTFTGHNHSLNSARFSPDGKYVVSTGFLTARLWDVLTGKELFTFLGHSGNVKSANFSPDGNYIVTASSDRTSKLWDANNGMHIGNFKGHDGVLTSACFSSSSKQILTSSWDDTAKLWDTETFREIETLIGHHSWVNATSFSPDDEYILTTSRDSTSKYWINKSSLFLSSVPLLADFTTSEIRKFNLVSLLVQSDTWDEMLTNASIQQVKAFGLYFQMEVKSDRNPETYTEHYQKAIECFQVAHKRSDNSIYSYYLLNCYKDWGEKLQGSTSSKHIEIYLKSIDEREQKGFLSQEDLKALQGLRDELKELLSSDTN